MKPQTKNSIALVAGQIFPLGVTQPCRETVFSCWLRYHRQEIVNLWSKRKDKEMELLDFAMYVFDCERGIVEPNLN